MESKMIQSNEKKCTDYASRQSDKTLLPIAAARRNKLNLWNGASNGAVKKMETV
jgi:hypothetical protein